MPIELNVYQPTGNHFWQCYRVNAIRRRNTTTGALLVSSVVSAPAWTFVGNSGWANGKQFYDGSREYIGEWQRTAGITADPTIKWTMTLDLGQEVNIGAISVDWLGGNWRSPENVLLEYSLDGTSWSQLSPSMHITHPNFVNRPLVPITINHLRIDGTGTVPGAIHPLEIFLYPSWYNPVPILGNGLNILYGCPDTQLINDTPSNWGTFSMGNIPPVGYMGGLVGAAGDAIAIIDLGTQVQAVGLVLCYGNNGAWEHGLTLQVRPDDSSAWETVYNTSQPLLLGDDTPLMFSAEKTVFQVKIINKRGTYASGHPNAGSTGTGTGLVGAIELIGASDSYIPEPLTTRTISSSSYISASVRDSNGDIISPIVPWVFQPASETPIPIYWNGKDYNRNVLPNGDYELLFQKVSAESHEETEVLALLGNSGIPNAPFFPNPTIWPNAIRGICVPNTDHYITLNDWTEEGIKIQYVSFDGERIWSDGAYGYGMACTTDGTSVWASSTGNDLSTRVQRWTVSDGARDSDEIVVDIPESPTIFRDMRPVIAMTVEPAGNGLFFVNHGMDRVEVWHKTNMTAINKNALSISNPTGLCKYPGQAIIAVCNSGNKISFFSYNVSTHVINSTPVAEITGLNDPGDIDMIDRGGGSIRLYCTEIGNNRIKEWNVSNLASISEGGNFNNFGIPYEPGLLLDNKFAFTLDPESLPGIVAVPNSGLILIDSGNRRQIYYDANASVIWQTHRTHEATPYIDRKNINGNTIKVINTTFIYEVNLDGTPFSDGLAEGNWRVSHNLRPHDDLYCDFENMSPGRGAISLDVSMGGSPDIRDFYYIFNASGQKESCVTVMQNYSGDNFRRSVILGSGWRGISGKDSKVAASWIWRDTDGTGLFGSPDDPIVNGANDKIIQWSQGHDMFNASAAHAVDAYGTIWICQCVNFTLGHGNWAVKWPIYSINGVRQFDVHGNPIYRFEDIVKLVDYGALTNWNGTTNVGASSIHPLSNNDYLLTTYQPSSYDNMIRKFNSSNVQIDRWRWSIRSTENESTANYTNRVAGIINLDGYFCEGAGSDEGKGHTLVRSADTGMPVAFRLPDHDGYPDLGWPDAPTGALDAINTNNGLLAVQMNNYVSTLTVSRFKNYENPDLEIIPFTWNGLESWEAIDPPDLSPKYFLMINGYYSLALLR